MVIVGCSPEGDPHLAAPDAGQLVTDGGVPEFPCEVREVLQEHCSACHASRFPFIGTTPSLQHRPDWLVRGRQAPTQGETAVLRLDDPASPMPPSSVARRLTASEIGLIRDWVEQGMPAGACAALDPP